MNWQNQLLKMQKRFTFPEAFELLTNFQHKIFLRILWPHLRATIKALAYIEPFVVQIQLNLIISFVLNCTMAKLTGFIQPMDKYSFVEIFVLMYRSISWVSSHNDIFKLHQDTFIFGMSCSLRNWTWCLLQKNKIYFKISLDICKSHKQNLQRSYLVRIFSLINCPIKRV